MDPSRTALCVEIVPSPGSKSTDAEALTCTLIEELSQIPTIGVERARGKNAALGTKSVSLGLGEIIIALGATGAAIPTAITAIKEWLTRQRPATTIKIKQGDLEFEWSGTTPPEAVSDLIAALLGRREH